MVSIFLIVAVFFASSVSAKDLDVIWQSWLIDAPNATRLTAEGLALRADSLVAALLRNTSAALGDIDVVVSGGGNFDGFYMGAQMVLSRLEAAGALRRHRYGGASAGGMMPFEVALKGENRTLWTHLSYGLLEETYPASFSNDIAAAILQDHHWRLMAAWQAATWGVPALSAALDGIVFLALSCFKDWELQLVVVSTFPSVADATASFMATGTYVEEYDGMVCTDGGATSGPKMTPLFQDHTRPQLIVDLMATGQPISIVTRYNVSQYVELIRQGQDEMIAFLQYGPNAQSAITLCPTNATVTKNVCSV